MIDLNKLIESKFDISKKLNCYLGSYSVPLSRITFEYNDPFSFKVPYNISEKEFINSYVEIQKALTFSHEFTHFIQSWSTTTGILEFLYKLNQLQQLEHIQEITNYNLPLDSWFNKELHDPKNYSKPLHDKSFISLMLGFKYQLLNYKWLLGTISPDAIDYEKCKVIAENGNYYKSYEIEFISDWLDEGYGMSGKEYFLINLLSLNKANKKKYDSVVSPIGLLHLQECFAKSVEFEHLLWFNRDIAKNYINDWIFKDNLLTYNAPFRMLYTFINPSERGKLNLVYAHLRIFIDISLMYSDFLNLDESALIKGSFSRQLESLKINPGNTYFKVLEAFKKVSALKNHEDDVLRLYSDLCSCLNIPSLDEMLKRTLNLVDGFLQYQFPPNSPINNLFLAARELISLKLKNPLLFINDLIYMPKMFELFNSISNYITILTPSGPLISEDELHKDVIHSRTGLILEAKMDIANQILISNEFYCPLRRKYNICFEKYNKCDCYIIEKKWSSNCQIGIYIQQWIDNQVK